MTRICASPPVKCINCKARGIVPLGFLRGWHACPECRGQGEFTRLVAPLKVLRPADVIGAHLPERMVVIRVVPMGLLYEAYGFMLQAQGDSVGTSVQISRPTFDGLPYSDFVEGGDWTS